MTDFLQAGSRLFSVNIKSHRGRVTWPIAIMLHLVIVASVAFSGLVQAQVPGPLPASRGVGDSNGSSVLSVSNEDYFIGPGDVIVVKVDKADELSQSFQVSAKGTILMNYLGSLSVVDKTPLQVQAVIADSLRGRYLRNPYVTVTVTQYNSRTFFIQGAVRSPGVYQVRGRPSLLTLITLAGGLDKDHGSTAYVMRKLSGDELSEGGKAAIAPAGAETADHQTAGASDRYEMLKANIEGLLKGNLAQNLDIQPGDIVNIPPSDVFFVAGEVRRPGSFTLKQGTTLRQAISLAEGTTFKASTGKGIIFREDPTSGKRQEIPVDIGAVMKGKKQADLTILANDVIVVPNSTFKSLSSIVLNGPVLNSISLIYRY
jgi:polysaccharide biosynthesis/export protein